MAQWNDDAVVRWRGGSMAQWFDGAVVRWRGGMMARWFDGGHKSRHYNDTKRKYIHCIAVSL
ncbi:MAG TPA: hypothetical protein VNG51_11620 [Ktedonobacteraceae bacterium]|nr:hypothetical protein [Ktedonobacteraceae bacterium]